jgi:hypothetical protein
MESNDNQWVQKLTEKYLRRFRKPLLYPFELRKQHRKIMQSFSVKGQKLGGSAVAPKVCG